MRTSAAAVWIGFGLMLTPLNVHASPGDVDLSFDPGSRLFGTVACLAIQPDAKILVGGAFATVPGAVRRNLARLNPDGSADGEFLDAMAGPDAGVQAIAIQSDGKVLIGGMFRNVNGHPCTALARLESDGSLDESFPDILAGPDPTTYIHAIAVGGDGKIIISGIFTNIAGVARPGLARLLPTGVLDTSFLDDLSGPYGQYGVQVNLALQQDGKVIIAGMFTSVNGTARTNLARLNVDGSLDLTFLAGQPGPDDLVNAMGFQRDGRLVIGGYFNSFNGVACGRIARLNADGLVDPSFAAGQSGVNYSVYHLFIQSDDRVLLGGNFTEVHGKTRNRLARLQPDGSLDSGFLEGMAGANGNVGPIAAQLDGRIVIGGGFETFNGQAAKALTRLNTNGTVDSTFFAGPTGPDGTLYSVLRQPDGRVVIGGVFRNVNNLPYSCIARLHPDGSVDTTFANASGLSDSLYGMTLQPDGKILAWGRYFNLRRVNPDGTRDTSFLPSLLGTLRRPQSLALQPDGRMLIGGQFSNIGGVPRQGIARLHSNGKLDTSHVASVSGGLNEVSEIALQADGKAIIGGQFTAVNGFARPFLARLLGDGSLDETFLPGLAGPNGGPGCIAVQPDGRIVVWGYFTEFNGRAKPGLVRLHPNGVVDDTFANGLSGLNGTVYSMHLQGDGKILLGGGFTEVHGVGRKGLARLNADGTLDTSFQDAGLGANGFILSFAEQPDGNLLIGGQFTAVNQTARAFVARLIGCELPIFLNEPSSRTIETGSDARLKVNAAGYPSPGAQWFWEGHPLPGATSLTLDLPRVQSGQAGTYFVVVSNGAGSITSAPVQLSVIAPVARRLVPALYVSGTAGHPFHLEAITAPDNPWTWTELGGATLDSATRWWVDETAPLAPTRLYRVWQPAPVSAPPDIKLHVIPALTLTGGIGAQVRVEAIHAVGPVDAWFPLETVSLTNTAQPFFDFTATGQAPRLYRLNPIP